MSLEAAVVLQTYERDKEISLCLSHKYERRTYERGREISLCLSHKSAAPRLMRETLSVSLISLGGAHRDA